MILLVATVSEKLLIAAINHCSSMAKLKGSLSLPPLLTSVKYNAEKVSPSHFKKQ